MKINPLVSVVLGTFLVSSVQFASAHQRHECFLKFQHRRLQGAEPIQLQRVDSDEDCHLTCLALGPDTCKSYVINERTGLCKLYSFTKVAKHVNLRRTHTETYYERDAIGCSDSDADEVLSRQKRVRRQTFPHMPGPPGAITTEETGGEAEIVGPDVDIDLNIFESNEVLPGPDETKPKPVPVVVTGEVEKPHPPPPDFKVTLPPLEVKVTPPPPEVKVTQPPPEVKVTHPPPEVRVTLPPLVVKMTPRPVEVKKPQPVVPATGSGGSGGHGGLGEVHGSQNFMEWSEWSQCSKTCGEGIRHRTFVCGTGFGVTCFTQAKKTQTCYDRACSATSSVSDADGYILPNHRRHRRAAKDAAAFGVVWDNWQEWGDCSVTCGSGKKVRTRKCKGYGCQGSPTEQADCGVPCCKDWTVWSKCSQSCGGGIKERTQVCGNTYAPEIKKESSKCNESPCPEWGQWAKWSICTVSCAGGTKTRTRECSVYGGCTGESNQDAPCNEQPCPEWTKWGPWAPCSATCGGGTQRRARTCNQYNLCPGDKFENRNCNMHKCASWMDWEEWGKCSVPCGAGERQRTRVCDTDASFCSTNAADASCECEGVDKEKEICDDVKCPKWSTWGPWGECSLPCGGGDKERKRTCEIDEAFCSGPDATDEVCTCPGLDHSNDQCNAHACAYWGQWKKWSECSQNCGGGIRTKNRECITDASFCASNGGDISCTCQPEMLGGKQVVDLIEEPCNEQSCAKWGEWTDWGSCSVTCGAGQQERTRVCINDDSFCGSNPTDEACICVGDDKETKDCNDGDCPVWGEWVDWGQCSVTCGDGMRTRTRTCSRTDAPCIGDDKGDVDEEPCNDGDCPEWESWTDWGQCSVTCGDGVQKRTRTCSRSDAPCVGDDKGDADEQPCNDGACPEWGPWTDWGQCSVTCGDGMQSRTRTCSRDDAPCVGDDKGDKDEQSCNDGACPEWSPWEPWGDCSVTCAYGRAMRKRTCSRSDAPCPEGPDGKGTDDEKDCDLGDCPVWGKWTEWTPCSVTCSTGEQTRSRECSRDDAPCDNDGHGAVDLKPCDKGTCPQWSSWETWTECTVLCGGGSRTRARTCPLVDGCAGLNEETSVCNQIPCPDWGLWGPWADCTRTCGGGAQSRTRTCPIPKACTPGEPFEANPDPCNTHQCPSWAQWAEWSPCSMTCDEGQRTKNRVCENGPGCLGRSEDIEPCLIQPCQASIFWSDWSPCTKTCDLGKKFRSRVTCVEGPPKCPQEQEDEECNPQACPNWMEWGEWSECSRKCGKGQRDRKRGCPVVNGCVGQATEIDPMPCNDVPCRRKRSWFFW